MVRKMEIELKLQIVDKDLWETLPKSTWLKGLMGDEPATVKEMEATYYDTPSRILWAAGYAFRIRREGTDWMATLKGAGRSGGGLHQRREWNVPLSGGELDPEILGQMAGADKVVKLLRGQPGLVPLLKTAFTRWSVLVHPQGSTGLLELVMDKGVISAGDKSEDIYEVEIELKEGTARDLLAFGAELARRYPLLPEWKSKYYRGLRLAELPVESTEKTTTEEPSTAGTFLAEALGAVLKAQIAYVAKPDAVEEIHDLRVSLRKLRSRLSFAAPLYPAEEGKLWKDIFRGWSGRMTRMRDLDVLQEEWVIAAEYCEVDKSDSLLTIHLQNQRDKLAGPLEKVVSKGKLTADVLAFWAWFTTAETAGEMESAWRVYAIQRLGQWLKDLHQRAKQVDSTDVAALHRLRILGKKARYILEWHAQRHGDRDTVLLAAKLQQFQDSLGEIHDTAQGISSLHKLGQGRQAAELAREIACLAGWQARRAYEARQRFGSQNKECRIALKRWLKSRTEG